MTPTATRSRAATRTETDSSLCPCPACVELRNGIAALDQAGALPLALRHDDGSPVMVDIAGAEITAVEAHLRLALVDLDPGDDKMRRRIQKSIADVHDPPNLAAAYLFDVACRLVGDLR